VAELARLFRSVADAAATIDAFGRKGIELSPRALDTAQKGTPLAPASGGRFRTPGERGSAQRPVACTGQLCPRGTARGSW
jgi:hypothetical protein